MLLASLCACHHAGKRSAPSAADCGFSITDWCESPPGDACGRHKDTASCRADPACVGMQYRGESVAACELDPQGYATNCPTVGCISRAAK